MALVRFKELESLYWTASGSDFLRTAYFSLPTHYYLIDPIIMANGISAGPQTLVAPSVLESTFGATSSADLSFNAANCDIENWRDIGFSRLSPATPDDFSVLKNWIKVNFSQTGINPNGWDVNVHFVRVPNGESFAVGVFCYFGNQATDVDKVPLTDYKVLHLTADFFSGVTNGNEIGSTWTDFDQGIHANTFAKTGTGLKKNVTSFTDPHGNVHNLTQIKMTTNCTMILPENSYLQNNLVSGNGVTITILIKVLALGSDAILCDYRSTGDGGLYCGMNADGNLAFIWGSNGCSTTTEPCEVGNYYLLTFFKWNGLQQIFVNGVAQLLTGGDVTFANTTDLTYTAGEGNNEAFAVLSRTNGTIPATNAVELYSLIIETALDDRSNILTAPGVDILPPYSFLSTKYEQYVLPPELP